MTRQHERRLVIGVAVALVATPLLAVIGWYGLWELPARSEARRLGAELDARSVELSTRGWARPPLRGAAIAGNAATEAQSIATRIAVPRGLRLEDALCSNAVPSQRVRDLLEKNAPRLEALAASTRRPVAQLADPLLAPGKGPPPDSGAHLRAVRLLLLYAKRQPAGRCLSIAADAVRLAQDQVSGGGILRLAIASAEIESAVTILVHCAKTASPDELRRSARELDSLALHPAPTGDALEGEALFAAGLLRAEYTTRPKWPRFTGTAVERARANPRSWLDAWRRTLSDAAVLGAVDPSRYPEALDALPRLRAAARDSPNPLLPPLADDLEPHLLRDARAQGKLRAAAIALRALSGDAFEPGLVDPFSGKPLGVSRSPGRVRVWSVGPNRRDDAGGPTSDDVVVEVASR